MTEPESRGPLSILMPGPDGVYPGPSAAAFLTLAGLFATGIMVSILGELPFIAAAGIGQAIGLGGVAALGARRVPAPHPERIGLRGFAPRLVVPLLCLLPVVVLVSEFDNYVRMAIPPSPEMAELREQIAELMKIDSTYAAIQTAIVAVGISPVVEGFFFFGVLQQGLVARIGRMSGVILTAVLYSIVHFPASGAPGDAIVPLASALIIGSLLGLARLGSGSVLAAIGLAGAFAAVHLIAADGTDYISIAGFNGPGDHTPILILLPCLISVLYGAATLWRLAAVAEVNLPIPPEEPVDDDEGGFFF